CFFASRRRHTSFSRDWSSDVCSSDLIVEGGIQMKDMPLIVTTDWLAEHAEDPGLRIIDATVFMSFPEAGGPPNVESGKQAFTEEIGRASCRVRVWRSQDAGCVSKEGG